MAVLGIVVQEAGTRTDIRRRLTERFGAARFSPSTVYNSLPSLVADGRLRLVSGTSPDYDRYEALPAGIDEIREWLRRPDLPAIQPDALDGILAFAEPEDMPRIVRIIRKDQADSVATADLAHAALLTHKRLLRQAGTTTWRDRVRTAELEHEARRWVDRVKQMRLLADSLALIDTSSGE
jgi:DNA-binding PadR family transcriptional regulator